MAQEKISQQETEEDIRKNMEIEVVATTPGGKAIITGVEERIKQNIATLRGSYQNASHAELIALCADLNSSYEVLEMFMTAKNNREAAEKYLAETYPPKPEEEK